MLLIKYSFFLWINVIYTWTIPEQTSCLSAYAMNVVESFRQWSRWEAWVDVMSCFLSLSFTPFIHWTDISTNMYRRYCIQISVQKSTLINNFYISNTVTKWLTICRAYFWSSYCGTLMLVQTWVLLACTGKMLKQTVDRLGGEWVTVDPRSWHLKKFNCCWPNWCNAIDCFIKQCWKVRQGLWPVVLWLWSCFTSLGIVSRTSFSSWCCE